MSVETLALSLGLTLLFELPVAWAWGLRRRELALAVLVNVLTNPPVVLGYYLLARAVALPALALQLPLEAAAVLVEGWCYRACGRDIRRPMRLSLTANAVSYGGGLVLGLIRTLL